MNIPANTSDAALERERRQLNRLQTLVDVMFALMLWRIVSPLPLPEATDDWSFGFLGRFLVEHADEFLSALIGVVLIIIYWSQSNALMGNLVRTNTRHAAFIIIQIVFLMLYGYAMRLGEILPGLPGPQVLQSLTLAGLGFAGVAGWSYAMRDRRLLSPAISDPVARQLRISVLPEPLTALLTIPFAFLGPWYWELSWLLYIPIAAWLRKREARKASGHSSEA
jgi:hypothetical protein